MESGDKIKRLRAIIPNGKARDERGLSEAEGVEMILAKRRGATIAQLGAALGKKSASGNVLSMMGTWAFRYARVSSGGKHKRAAQPEEKSRGGV